MLTYTVLVFKPKVMCNFRNQMAKYYSPKLGRVLLLYLYFYYRKRGCILYSNFKLVVISIFIHKLINFSY